MHQIKVRTIKKKNPSAVTKQRCLKIVTRLSLDTNVSQKYHTETAVNQHI